MKILVVGSGGREHALAWKLAQEADVIAAPGNPGIAECATCFPVPVDDFGGLGALAQSQEVDLAVVGPEGPLIAGLADHLRSRGLAVFGPGAEGARLEGSKAFAKALMKEAGVRTADFEVFQDARAAHDYVDSRCGGVVVKASGAALGKGVIVASSPAEAHEAIDSMLLEDAFGPAGRTVVIEDRLSGPEFSLLTLCTDGPEPTILSLPVAQDYKRALDGDRGPNTGGMGSYSPVPWITPEAVKRAEDRTVLPVLSAMRARGIPFRGVLYSGMMVHGGEPYCLEFNVRFGDPEIQSIVLRLGKGFADALLACASGKPIPPIEVLDNAAVTVVLASGGYPGTYEKGKAVAVGPLPSGARLFHAGTTMREGALVTSGGRVAAISARGLELGEARDRAYEGVHQIGFEGLHFRRDIALEYVAVRPGPPG